MSKAIFSIEKVHSTREFNGKYKHNYRENRVENADPAKTGLNKELISLEGKTYNQAFREKINSLPYYKKHNIRSNNVRGIEVMLTYGSKNIPDGFDQKKWEEENVKWLQNTFGKENVVSAVVHYDETTPHIHAMVIPIDENGCLNAKEIIGGPSGLSEKQQSYADCMSTLGLEKRMKYSVAKHEDIKRFYSAINNALVQKLPEPKHNEDVADYFKRAQSYFEKRNLQNIAIVKEMSNKINELKTASVQSDINYAAEMSEYYNLKKIMGDNINEMRKKIQLIEHINKGLQDYPDREYVQDVKEAIQEIILFAKERERNMEITTSK